MCSPWQQFRAIAKIKQQSILNGILVLKRLDPRAEKIKTAGLYGYVALAVAERVNSLLTPFAVYNLSEKLRLRNESEFEEGLRL